MKKLISVILVMLIIGAVLGCSLSFNKFKISFLNVGQGDSVFIRTPDDYTVLIDGGPSMNVLDELAEVMPIYSRTVDLLILSHPHADHVNGLVEIVKRYSINKALIVGSEYRNAYYEKLLSLLREKKIDVIFADSKHDFKIGNYVFLDVVWPLETNAGKTAENINNASLALRVIYKDKIIFLGGDAEIEEENEMLADGFDLNADILKAGHHGSRTASSENFLNSVNPEIVVIQSESGNNFGHPHKETLTSLFNRGIEIRRNDKEGRVEFIF